MKKLLTLLALLLCLTAIKAQYVTIPDPNFVTWLQANVPSAMNGNQMDTTSLAVTTRTVIVLLSSAAIQILDHTGLLYFRSLKTLNIYINNNVQNMPTLPSTIENLIITNSSFTFNITSFPTNLKYLSAELYSTNLPAFPSGLQSINLRLYSHFTWPQLPMGLKKITCTNTSSPYTSQYLPPLPNGLREIDCFSFGLDSLPQILPDSLISLNCGRNPLLTQLPSLPSKLKYLRCDETKMISLPVIPNSLLTLNCSNNKHLTSLPNLPITLKELTCNNDQKIQIISLPDSLEILNCDNDSLTYLPTLPKKLKALYAASNKLSCIPTLPSSIIDLQLLGNPFNCLPNYLPTMPGIYFTYPLCAPGNTLTNPNGCERANGIIGNAYFDTNTNCLRDTDDTKLNNINFKLFDNNNQYLSQTSSHTFGVYNFTYPTGDYTVVLDTLNVPYTSQCNYPGIDTTIQLTSLNPTAENIDFSVKCKSGFDVGVQSVLTNGIVFPGQNHHLKIAAGDMSQWYNLKCATGVSGQLTINVSGPVTYIAPTLGSLTPIVSGTTFTYNIADFGSVNFLNDFNIILKTDTTATAGDSICVSVNVTPISGDNNVNNNTYNLCYGVVNSYDPNMKEVYPINVEPNYNDWFTYTIHFQNTGNAPAFNIRLVDTLDANLDLETFKVTNYSHHNTWSINNKVAFFNFQNIQLPDSTSDSEGSKGYVQYKIKPKNNLGTGTKIKNTAYIYFDYNNPIVTNTTINEYLQVVSIKENFKEFVTALYPNPTNGSFTIELTTKEKLLLLVYDITGNVVVSQTIENGKAIIDAANLAAGIYNISIKGNASITNKKLVIVK
ncbi:MAG: T9SS type A sorting domain-containing protein [Bacteroidia bacterium]|nr:T9SS type A sorting domain-containing protein [Bacteroidia bacterium]